MEYAVEMGSVTTTYTLSLGIQQFARVLLVGEASCWEPPCNSSFPHEAVPRVGLHFILEPVRSI
jgi:hypothetical protein